MSVQKIIKLPFIAILLVLGLLMSQSALAQPGYNVPVESFYDDLAPYGQWMDHPNYGNVWLPSVDPDFQPYATQGHWVMTEYGNTWVSDYAWGWAPFHYGRWIYDPAFGGWLWIPGSEWGPAWVSWRSGGGYYGWAPLGPGMNINVNINIPAPYWTFVPQMYFNSPRWYSYCVPRPNIMNVYYGTSIINNYYRSNNRMYAYGPPRADIERYSRGPVTVYRIDPMDRPGRSVIGNGSVGFYRPNQGMAYGRSYERSDRNNRTYRSDYNNNPGYSNGPSGRGGYSNGPAYSNTPNSRDYSRNGMPSREYNTSGPNRSYDNNSRGGFRNDVQTERSYNNSAGNVPNRFESSRGSYSPSQSQQRSMSTSGGMSRAESQSNRIERSSQMSTPSAGRSESRGQQMQGQQRSMESSQRSNSGGRGPR